MMQLIHTSSWKSTASDQTRVGLVVSSSGASGNPIVYGAYGTGNDPKFNVNNAANVHGVYLYGKNWVTVQDLDIANANKTGVSCLNSNNINLLRLDVDTAGGSGINLRNGGNIMVDGCTVIHSGDGGFYCRGESNTDKLHDVTIQNCTAHDLDSTSDGFALHQRNDSPYTGIGSVFKLYNNTAYNCPEQGFDIVTGTDVEMKNNISYNNTNGGIAIGHSADTVHISYHKSWGEPVADSESTIKISAPRVTIEYSTFVGSTTVVSGATKPIVRFVPSWDSHALVVDGQPTDTVLRNNVFVWDSTGTGNALVTASNQGNNVSMTNFTMQNNIWTSRGSGAWTMYYTSNGPAPSDSSFVIDNNLYYQASGTNWWKVNSTTYNFADYKTNFGRDLNAIAASSPDFVNLSTGDFHLASTSPAIDAGASVGLTRDFENNPVAQGSAPDIGAFERSAIPSTPLSLVATTISSTQIDLSWDGSAINNETGFEVDRATDSGFTTGPAPIVSSYMAAANASGVSATGLYADTQYYFRVRATNATGDSANSATANATTSIDPALKIWYNFNEIGGTSAADSSGSGNTGTLSNGPSWTTGGHNAGGLSFDGLDDLVNAGSASSVDNLGALTRMALS